MKLPAFPISILVSFKHYISYWLFSMFSTTLGCPITFSKIASDSLSCFLLLVLIARTHCLPISLSLSPSLPTCSPLSIPLLTPSSLPSFLSSSLSLPLSLSVSLVSPSFLLNTMFHKGNDML